MWSQQKKILQASVMLVAAPIAVEAMFLEEALAIAHYQKETNQKEKELLKAELIARVRANRSNNQHPILKALNQSFNDKDIIKTLEQMSLISETEAKERHKDLIELKEALRILKEKNRKLLSTNKVILKRVALLSLFIYPIEPSISWSINRLISIAYSIGN